MFSLTIQNSLQQGNQDEKVKCIKKIKGAGRGALTASGGTDRLIRSYDHDAGILNRIKTFGVHAKEICSGS